MIHRRGAEGAELIYFPFAVERTAKGNRSVPLKAGRFGFLVPDLP